MGTRSLTLFMDAKKEICVLYRQYDGNPNGHGQDLKDRFGKTKIVNGLSVDPGERDNLANGMDCLAAQVVAHFKKGAGDFYLYPAGTRDTGEEFIYTLYCPTETGVLHLKVQGGAVTYFGLPGTKQSNMPVLYDGPISKFNADKATKVYREIADEVPNDYLESKKTPSN